MIRSLCTIALGALMSGCYTLQPAMGVAPEPGSEVAFDVNDQGRVALGGQIGPEVSQIEGRLLEKANGEYLVAVSTVRLFRGGEQVWRGERVRISEGHINTTYRRSFSRGRTITASAIAIGGFAAIFLTRSLVSSFGEDDGGNPDNKGGDGQGLIVRIRR
jgi:hypothetical protein